MPDIKYNKELIMDKLLEYAKENGFEDLSARKLANYIGCSVMPIYTAYGDMGQLIEKARETIIDMIVANMDREYIKNNTLINAGVAVVCFARDYEYLYREVFINSANRTYIRRIIERIQSIIVSTGNTMYEELTEEELNVFLTKSWIMIQGMSAMVCSGQLQNASNKFIGDAIQEMGTNLLRGMLYDKGILFDIEYYQPYQFTTEWRILGEE